MSKITTFLTFNDQAEEAVNLYTSLFENSKINTMNRYGAGSPLPEGTVMSANFELDGQPFIALNGGPTFNFAEGISLFVNCDDQDEVDQLWDSLTADGGQPGQCGWLKDKFGVSWQIVPKALPELLNGDDKAGAARAMQAMMQMTKINVQQLQDAYDNEANA